MITAENIPPAEMPLYMNACDLLLLTSTHEGSPVVTKEAIACNLPIVSVNVGDVEDQLKGIEGCIVCNDDNVVTISKAIEDILNRGGRLNAEKYSHNFDNQNYCRKQIEIYTRLRNKRKSTF
jgi:glycosyltransferase involved in cell wall biosynthesis